MQCGFSPTPDARTDMRSDQQLLDAWQETDNRAFDELDRRYRARIHRRVQMQFSNEDSEDIVQETLLRLFLARTSLRDVSSLDELIDEQTSTTMLARSRGMRRRERLLFAVAREAITDDTARESCNRPDEELHAIELAAHVGESVNNLPGWCRRPFWLRVVQGKSATQAGAMLDTLPAIVDLWLDLARGLIAGDLRRSMC